MRHLNGLDIREFFRDSLPSVTRDVRPSLNHIAKIAPAIFSGKQNAPFAFTLAFTPLDNFLINKYMQYLLWFLYCGLTIIQKHQKTLCVIIIS